MKCVSLSDATLRRVWVLCSCDVLFLPQATDARRAFPCWDEPAIKGTFDITLIVPKDRVALSNMVSFIRGTLTGYQIFH